MLIVLSNPCLGEALGIWHYFSPIRTRYLGMYGSMSPKQSQRWLAMVVMLCLTLPSQWWRGSLGLKGLYDVHYTSTNKAIINAFIERSHSDASLFHLSVEEMTITLDDVLCLLSLITHRWATPTNNNRVLLSWSHRLYHTYVASGSYV